VIDRATPKRSRTPTSEEQQLHGTHQTNIDFDAVTRDPNSPTKLLPQYDSGDHLHPNDAGYQAMGNAVNLELFKTAMLRQTASQ
jgi:lysophospholipase L1-like esterase